MMCVPHMKVPPPIHYDIITLSAGAPPVIQNGLFLKIGLQSQHEPQKKTENKRWILCTNKAEIITYYI